MLDGGETCGGDECGSTYARGVALVPALSVGWFAKIGPTLRYSLLGVLEGFVGLPGASERKSLLLGFALDLSHSAGWFVRVGALRELIHHKRWDEGLVLVHALSKITPTLALGWDAVSF
jgi:hypothetical protein